MQDCFWVRTPNVRRARIDPAFRLLQVQRFCHLGAEAAANGPAPELEGTATLSYRGLKMPDLTWRHKVLIDTSLFLGMEQPRREHLPTAIERP